MSCYQNLIQVQVKVCKQMLSECYGNRWGNNTYETMNILGTRK